MLLIAIDPSAFIGREKFVDGGDIIVRLFESTGRMCEAVLRLWFTPRDVYETDMIEWDRYVQPTKYHVEGGVLRIPMNPFEIKSLRIKL
jgi:alpha-mannosidase